MAAPVDEIGSVISNSPLSVDLRDNRKKRSFMVNRR